MNGTEFRISPLYGVPRSAVEENSEMTIRCGYVAVKR